MTIMTLKQQACIMSFTNNSCFFLPERKRSVELCKRENKACLQDVKASNVISVPKCNKGPKCNNF